MRQSSAETPNKDAADNLDCRPGSSRAHGMSSLCKTRKGRYRFQGNGNACRPCKEVTRDGWLQLIALRAAANMQDQQFFFFRLE